MMKNYCSYKRKKLNYRIDKSPKQEEAIRLIAEFETVILKGGGRSGKTFIALYVILVRALKAFGSAHLAARFRFAHIKQSVCYQTMPELLRLTGQTNTFKLNKSDWFYESKEGSTLWICGLDDKQRTEKILGNEYSTIFLNEASQISYEARELLITRLNPSHGLNAKEIIDYNPPSITHWGYKMDVDHKFPDGRPIPKGQFGSLLMNPEHNPHLGKGYLERLEQLSEAKKLRFLKGEYSVDSGSLWKRKFFVYNSYLPKSMWRIVIGVDPTGSVDGDECGIVVAGEFEDLFYVLEDYSLHGSPNEWAKEVVRAYKVWSADCVVAEKNFGGEMVESVIHNVNRFVAVKLVHSSKGKVVRAEPVSTLYERGRVFHRLPFPELETECCMFRPDLDKSPNRMDALVFAVTELMGEGVSMLDVLYEDRINYDE